VFAALQAWRRALRHLNHRGYVYIWGNVLWIVLTLPLLTAPAAWAGINRLSYAAYRSPAASLDEFWQGFRENLKHSLVLGVVNLVVVIVNVSNLIAYQTAPGMLADVFRLLWVFALFLWFAVQLYMWPLYYAMERPTVTGALRNAAIMILLNPIFTLFLWLGVLIVIGFSVGFPVMWLLLTGGVLASAANSAVNDRLQAAGHVGDMPQPELPASDML
jgi:uncharacterized membrane protein YesL